MAGYEGQEERTVRASPQACFDALTDYERIPEWQPILRAARIEERDDRGRGRVVAYELDAKVKVVRYRLRLSYDEPHAITSEYLDGDFRDFSAEWHFTAVDDEHTTARLRVVIDPGRFVPGPVRSLVRDAVMTRALRDLDRRVGR